MAAPPWGRPSLRPVLLEISSCQKGFFPSPCCQVLLKLVEVIVEVLSLILHGLYFSIWGSLKRPMLWRELSYGFLIKQPFFKSLWLCAWCESKWLMWRSRTTRRYKHTVFLFLSMKIIFEMDGLRRNTHTLKVRGSLRQNWRPPAVHYGPAFFSLCCACVMCLC